MTGRGATIELILGGQRSGKSRLAEGRGLDWLDGAPGRRVSLIATAIPGDDEIADRIARHRAERPRAFATLEAPHDLGAAIDGTAAPSTLTIVDCLTLWLTNWLMPMTPATRPALRVAPRPRRGSAAGGWPGARAALIDALARRTGPVVLVSNEIGLGPTPLGRETRRFVDELGRLHREIGDLADRVSFVVAGQELTVKPGGRRD